MSDGRTKNQTSAPSHARTTPGCLEWNNIPCSFQLSNMRKGYKGIQRVAEIDVAICHCHHAVPFWRCKSWEHLPTFRWYHNMDVKWRVVSYPRQCQWRWWCSWYSLVDFVIVCVVGIMNPKFGSHHSRHSWCRHCRDGAACPTVPMKYWLHHYYYTTTMLLLLIRKRPMRMFLFLGL